MELIDSWCKTVCVVTIISAVIVSVIPHNKLSSSIKVLTAVILIYSVILPLTQIKAGDYKLDFSVSSPDNEFIENLATSDLIRCAQNELKKEAESILKKYNEESECTVAISAEEGEAVIESIEITGLFSSDEQKLIKEELCTAFGNEINIKFSG